MTAHAKIPFTEHANLLIGGTTAWHVVEVGFLKSNLFLNQFVGCKFSTIFVKTGQDIPQILTHLRLWGFYEIRNISFVTSQSVTATSKLDFLKNHQEQRKSLKPFVSLLSSEWYCPVCLEVGGNAEAGNSVKRIPFCVFFLIFF